MLCMHEYVGMGRRGAGWAVRLMQGRADRLRGNIGIGLESRDGGCWVRLKDGVMGCGGAIFGRIVMRPILGVGSAAGGHGERERTAVVGDGGVHSMWAVM